MLSVVIPTYNRCETLKKAIVAYQTQSAASEISELIVVDDGSTDSTPALIDQMAQHSALRMRYFRQQNKGPAAARNVGIQAASSPIILFTDDDIIPERGLVAEHLHWHSAYSDETAALLGLVNWSPELAPTPFMEWYGSEILFSFTKLTGGAQIDYRYFYTCNISLKTDFLRIKGAFDEDFKFAAFEDIELGFRLSKAGMKLYFNPQALAYHEQFITFRDACRRYQKTAAASVVFRQKDAARKESHVVWETTPRKKALKKWLAPALRPLEALMDWRFPLPWGVYRTMFRIYR
jgi:glycosyltransferase involved in cell wall biosynthesis